MNTKDTLTEIRGLSVEIMGNDCTAGGATSGKRRAVLVWPGMHESARVFAPSADAPLLEAQIDENPQGLRAGYLAIVKGTPTPGSFMSSYSNDPRIVRVRIVPAGEKDSGMFGGHFISSSDGRFPFTGPVPVFDRYER